MNDLEVGEELFAVVFFAIGGLVLGILGLGRNRVSRWALALSGILVIAGLSALTAHAAMGFWLPPLALGGSYLSLASFPYLNRFIARFFGARRGHAALVLALGPLLSIGWLSRSDPPADQSDVLSGAVKHCGMPNPQPAGFVAHTDHGHVIPLFGRILDGDTEGAANDREDSLRKTMSLQLIQIAPADAKCNCHGWVFTGGHFCILGRDVDTVLTDNGYTEVSQPQAGDLIVYRDPSGSVLHTGVVRSAEGNATLIESKWGALGRYLHFAATQSYSDHWSFYHSERRGHDLRIAEGS